MIHLLKSIKHLRDQNMKIKICGITKMNEVEFLNFLRPDYIGFVFDESARKVSIEEACLIYKKLDKRIKVVGVFRNNSEDFIKEVIKEVPLDVIQLHGEEGNDFIESIKIVGKEVWKGINIRIKDDMLKAMNYRVDALVLDSSMPGSGELFDWNLLQDINISNKIILAGGLNEDNVLEGISKVNPYGIDISSGVEKVDKDGIRKKDRDKVELFIRKVRDRYEREV